MFLLRSRSSQARIPYFRTNPKAARQGWIQSFCPRRAACVPPEGKTCEFPCTIQARRGLLRSLRRKLFSQSPRAGNGDRLECIRYSGNPKFSESVLVYIHEISLRLRPEDFPLKCRGSKIKPGAKKKDEIGAREDFVGGNRRQSAGTTEMPVVRRTIY